MDMGDPQTPYIPSYAPIRDDVIGKEFAPVTMRRCPEPHVIAKYGIGGVANVSIYTCRRCKYHSDYYKGVKCNFGLAEELQTRAQS